jgi:hypothetical protein
MTDNLTQRDQAEDTFTALDLDGAGLLEAWTAYEANPDGTIRTAITASSGRNPSGLFLHLIRKGNHLKPPRQGRKLTGWRFARGSHGGTYVKDPLGTDPLPKGYS